MHALVRTLAVAMGVIAVALTCIACGASANTASEAAVARTSAPTPTAVPSATAVPARSHSPGAVLQVITGDYGALEPGRRYALPSRGTNPEVSFSVPSGWTGNDTLAAKDYGESGPEGPVWFSQPFDHGFRNPCTDHMPVAPAGGSGPAGLLAVIAGQPGIKAEPITDVTVGGHAGKSVEYTVTTDPATCGNHQDDFWIWGTCPVVALGCENLTGDRRYGVALGSHERAYAIDVDGTIYTFFTKEPVSLTAADRAELQQVIDSIEFEPAG